MEITLHYGPVNSWLKLHDACFSWFVPRRGCSSQGAVHPSCKGSVYFGLPLEFHIRPFIRRYAMFPGIARMCGAFIPGDSRAHTFSHAAVNDPTLSPWAQNVVKEIEKGHGIWLRYRSNLDLPVPSDAVIFRLFRCQAVWNKTCAQLSLSQNLSRNPKNYSLGDVQSFCHHAWCDTMVFLTKSATATIFTSVRTDFGQPPLTSSSTNSLTSRNREYHLKTFDLFRASFP
jgi:hypothetical protein